MQETVTITLPADIKPALEDATRREGMSASELVTEALEEYLFFRRFRRLRERMIWKAQTQGVCTDQDVFDRVS